MAQPEEGTGVTFHTNNFTAMSRRAIALLTAAVTLSSIALIGVPAATADEQQATAEQNTAAKSSVIINEVYAGNTKNAGDPDSKRCDWVELKNCTYFDIAGEGFDSTDEAWNWCKANNYGPNDCMPIDLQ